MAFYDPGPRILNASLFDQVVRPHSAGAFTIATAGIWRIQYVLQITSGAAARTKYELIKRRTDGTEQVIRTVYQAHFKGDAALGGYTTSHPYQVVILVWYPFEAGEQFWLRCSVTNMYAEPTQYTALPEYFWPWVTDAVCETTLVGNQYPAAETVP